MFHWHVAHPLFFCTDHNPLYELQQLCIFIYQSKCWERASRSDATTQHIYWLGLVSEDKDLYLVNYLATGYYRTKKFERENSNQGNPGNKDPIHAVVRVQNVANGLSSTDIFLRFVKT
jgi:hypothetical protein